MKATCWALMAGCESRRVSLMSGAAWASAGAKRAKTNSRVNRVRTVNLVVRVEKWEPQIGNNRMAKFYANEAELQRGPAESGQPQDTKALRKPSFFVSLC